MNRFKVAASKAVDRNGVDAVYKSASKVVDEVNSSVVNTVTDYNVRVYPRHTQANQYNHPTLVGKEVIVFYLADVPLGLVLKINDVITYAGKSYTVQSWREHVAVGEICLYKIVTVKG